MFTFVRVFWDRFTSRLDEDEADDADAAGPIPVGALDSVDYWAAIILQSNGYTRVADLRAATVLELSDLPHIPHGQAARIVREASDDDPEVVAQAISAARRRAASVETAADADTDADTEADVVPIQTDATVDVEEWC